MPQHQFHPEPTSGGSVWPAHKAGRVVPHGGAPHTHTPHARQLPARPLSPPSSAQTAPTSGETYSAVPTKLVERLPLRRSVGGRKSAFALPKSMSWTWPASLSSRFSGLRSRWMTSAAGVHTGGSRWRVRQLNGWQKGVRWGVGEEAGTRGRWAGGHAVTNGVRVPQRHCCAAHPCAGM